MDIMLLSFKVVRTIWSSILVMWFVSNIFNILFSFRLAFSFYLFTAYNIFLFILMDSGSKRKQYINTTEKAGIYHDAALQLYTYFMFSDCLPP